MLAMLATQIQESSKRVIIRFTAEEPASIVEGVKAFEKADLVFAMERTLRPEDNPEMKSALAMVTWKNNELVETTPAFPSVEIIDADPGNMSDVIAMAIDNGWQVKTPTVWLKLLRDEARTYGGRRFYVSSEGDDNADGLSSGFVWRNHFSGR